MKPRSHFYVSSLAIALLYYQLNADSPFGGFAISFLTVFIVAHLADAAIDSYGLKRVKWFSLLLFTLCWMFTLCLIEQPRAEWSFWKIWLIGWGSVVPFYILSVVPIHRPNVASSEEEPVSL